METKWCKQGDGNLDRVVKNFDDGSSRQCDRRADGGITVTDIRSTGEKVSGEGATGIFGGLSTATRLNDTPGKI